MSVMTLTYAATQITSITQTAHQGDSITAAWVNEVNAALQNTVANNNGGVRQGECYAFSGVTEFRNILENTVGSPQSITLGGKKTFWRIHTVTWSKISPYDTYFTIDIVSEVPIVI